MGRHVHRRVDRPADPESAIACFQAWERIRVVLNAWLLLVVIGCCLGSGDWTFLTPRSGLRTAVFCAVGTNALFCVAPVLEGYGVLIGGPRRLLRAGLAFATFIGFTLVALLVLFMHIYPLPPD